MIDINNKFFNLLSKDQKIKLEFYNNTKKLINDNATIIKLFDEQVLRTPNEIALIFNDEQISYKTLSKKVDLLANRLVNMSIPNTQPIGIFINRGFNMIISILGILKAGFSYLPIDINLPGDRIKYMINDAKVNYIITEHFLVNKFVENESIKLIFIEDENLNSTGSGAYSNDNKMAYIIYTSGSSGKPKGIMIGQRSVCNFIEGVTEKINFKAGSAILNIATISFDIFFLETIVALTKGLRVIIADEITQKNFKLINRLINKFNIKMIQCTPSQMKILVECNNTGNTLKNLETIMIGGESFEIELLTSIKKLTKAKVYNMYGPTETTIWSSIKEVTHSEKITIGRPIQNTEYFVVNECNQCVPLGEEGELIISGLGLAHGYVKKSHNKSFIDCDCVTGNRFYKTGDLVKFDESGEIIFIDRIDNQVKIRGHRVELKEVELSIRKNFSVKDVSVVPLKNKLDINMLCAYIVCDYDINISNIKAVLSKELPSYMIPSCFAVLERLPYTHNGKLDYISLTDYTFYSKCALVTKNNFIELEDEIQMNNSINEKLKSLVKKAANIDSSINISINENLNNLGIDSLSFISLIVDIEYEFNIVFDDDMLLLEKFRSIIDLANYIKILIK
mgnify:FL=1